MIPSLIDDSERFKTSGDKINADKVETPNELKLEVKPEDVTELLQSHDKVLRSCFLRMIKEGDFLRWNLLMVKML